MERNKNLVINIPAEGIEEEVIRDFTLTKEEYRLGIERYFSEFLSNTPCGTVFLNICYKRSIVPSNTADTYLYNIVRGEDGLPILDEEGNVRKEISPEITISNLNRAYREMEKRGIDPIAMAVDIIRSYGCQVWFSVRMNDHHYPADRGFNSSFAYDRAEEVGVGGSKTHIDYTKTPVQNYYRNYIKELCTNYDIDGIELDYLRSCPVMEEPTEENMELLNCYVASVSNVVKTIAKAKGKDIGVASRIYPTEELNLSYGLDVVKWVAEGLVDIIIPEEWHIPTYFNIPVDKWRKSIELRNTKNHPYTLLCGTDWATRCDETLHSGMTMWLSLEQLKGFASASYSVGADGIYIFNHFNTNDTGHTLSNMGLYSCYLDKEGNKIFKNVLKEKICSVNSIEAAEAGKRCFVNTYSAGEKSPYPIEISADNSFEVSINTGTKLPEKYWNVVVGIDKNPCTEPICINVNGNPAAMVEDIRPPKDFVFKASEDPYPFVDHVSETAERVMCFKALQDFVKPMFNTVQITSNNGSNATVKWIEIHVE